jgi:hypothetical protein
MYLEKLFFGFEDKEEELIRRKSTTKLCLLSPVNATSKLLKGCPLSLCPYFSSFESSVKGSTEKKSNIKVPESLKSK